MVGSVNGFNPLQAQQATSKTRDVTPPKVEKTQESSASQPVDEVIISPQAQALSVEQAEQAATDVAQDLRTDTSVSLGLDPSYDQTV